ncbi:YdcF family protein [Alteromonas sp. A079]|uniref:YdcF family protein n=1 Tax=Alteromonas sp. A079 TaxID=3410268 RepID=UPI003B9F12F9
MAISIVIRKKNRSGARKFLVSGISILLLSSQFFVSDLLLRPLEGFAKKQQPQKSSYAFIAPLACFYDTSSTHIEISKWSECSLQRLAQAAIEYKKRGNLETKVLLSGGYFLHDTSIGYADKAKKLLVSLGINEQAIIALNKGTSTTEELTYIKAFVEKENTLIISSATHLYRINEQVKQKVNIDLLAVDFISSGVNEFHINYPSPSAIQNCQHALYEYSALLRDRIML